MQRQECDEQGRARAGKKGDQLLCEGSCYPRCQMRGTGGTRLSYVGAWRIARERGTTRNGAHRYKEERQAIFCLKNMGRTPAHLRQKRKERALSSIKLGKRTNSRPRQPEAAVAVVPGVGTME